MRRTRRTVSFSVCRGRLVRHVRLRNGRGYTQHCTLGTLQEVAGVVEDRREAGVTTNELWAALPDSPCTQISVALAFLKDCGCVETEGRRNYPVFGAVVEDALTEFHYLAHEAAGPGHIATQANPTKNDSPQDEDYL